MEIDSYGEVNSEYLQDRAVSSLSIVIDAPNVCWSYLRATPGFVFYEFPDSFRPPLHGLLACLKFFYSHGVKPVAVCPEWWNHTEEQSFWQDPSFEKEDFNIFKKLRNSGVLFCSPSGDHDDLYLIDYSFRTNGFIVSNDRFRDHTTNRGLNLEFIEQRRISYMWINGEFIPNPQNLKRIEEFLSSQKPVDTPAYQNKIPNPPVRISPLTTIQSSVMPKPKEKERQAVSTIHCQVPSRAVGFIIGRQGSKIRELERLTQTRIHIDKAAKDSMNEIEIIGNATSVKKAESLIQEIVERITLDHSNLKIAKPDTLKPKPILEKDVHTDADGDCLFTFEHN